MAKSLTFILFVHIYLNLAGCSFLSFNETPEEENTRLNDRQHIKDANHQQTIPSNVNHANTPNLWVWIAPEYREQQSDMQSEYIIIPVH